MAERAGNEASNIMPPHPTHLPPTDFKAIIGGGIGGLTLSLVEQCPGIDIDVYEQPAHYKENGAGVGIAVNPTKILHRLGVGSAANTISGERTNIHRSR